jgi:hypothetical protein
MSKPDVELLRKNRKVDQKVVTAAGILQEKMPEDAKPKAGSDYRISPALGGQSVTLTRRGKGF